MTNEDPLEQRFQELNCDTTQQQQQQQQQPFQVVLVDIKKAACKTIHCVEKPLAGDNTAFVALSYRWGELREQSVNTHLGYIATITSFKLRHFYKLCKMMTREPDLKSIDYVWVDAICVDQNNPIQRKATIHQMSTIYEKATYILAVPDLHLQHVINVSQVNHEIQQHLESLHRYIYDLIQGDADALHERDITFLDKIKVPHDPALRHLLTTYTDCFADGFTKPQQYHVVIGRELAVEHLYAKSQARDQAVVDADGENQTQTHGNDSLEGLHRCDQSLCPFELIGKQKNFLEKAPYHLVLPWKTQIIRRNRIIRQIMQFLEDLIRDWSTRVWVISEYNIAKKKNNLKYWFIGLGVFGTSDRRFFEFDFGDSLDVRRSRKEKYPYQKFHETMINLLNTQSFFEMMLLSKARKNEDRFHAILPLSKYKHQVEQVASWNIDSLLSVTLKLFDIVDTRDKLRLLYLTGHGQTSVSYDVLPTFSTSALPRLRLDELDVHYPCNFDVPTAITFRYAQALNLYSLQLTPKVYYVKLIFDKKDMLKATKYKKVLYDCLQLDEHSSTLDLVCIPYFDKKFHHRREYSKWIIHVVGCFAENKWILINTGWQYWTNKYICHDNKDHGTFFNIY